MKNICLIIPSLEGGGSERVMLNLAEKLAKSGHRVEVILLLENTRDYYVNTSLFNVHYAGETSKYFFVRRAKRFLWGLIYKKRFSQMLCAKIRDINVNFDLFVSNLVFADYACVEAKLSNLYCCIHAAISANLNDRERAPFLRRLHLCGFGITGLKRLYQGQKLITVSKGIEGDLLALGLQPKNVQTIYNPFNISGIREAAKAYEVEERDYLVFVGRFYRQKRIDWLIHAYAQSGIKQNLLLLGKGPDRSEVTELIAQLGLQDRVVMKGFISNPYPYIKAAKALVLSSEWEGLPTVLIEALILGTPVVSTDCPCGPNEILIDELAPFLSPVGDVKTLARNMKKMVDNPVKITDKYINRFSDKAVAEHYLSLCE